jgi:hypothetical protein
MYISEVYSNEMLKWFDYIVLTTWKANRRVLIILSRLGLGHEARIKAGSFVFLITWIEIV